MNLPFTIKEFLEVFRQYNLEVWPAQVFMILLALTAVYFSVRKVAYSNKIISAILSFFWLWMGIVYHLIYFSEINKAAVAFGAIFIFQSLLFIYFGVVKNKLQFQLKMNIHGITGIIFVSFSLLCIQRLVFGSGTSIRHRLLLDYLVQLPFLLLEYYCFLHKEFLCLFYSFPSFGR